MRSFLATFPTPLTKLSQRVQKWPEDDPRPCLSSGCSFYLLSQKCKLVDNGFLNFTFSLLHFEQMNLDKSRLLGRRQACKSAVSCWLLSFTSIYDPPARSKVGCVLTAARSATNDSSCEILSFAPKKCVNRRLPGLPAARERSPAGAAHTAVKVPFLQNGGMRETAAEVSKV